MDMQLNEERRRQILSDVSKLAGSMSEPGYKERLHDSLELVQQESEFKSMPSRDFRSMLYDHPALHDGHSRRPKKVVAASHPRIAPTNGSKKIVYIDLIRHIIEKTHRLPDDEIMKAYASGLGFTEDICATTRRSLEMSGYKLIPTNCGYDVAIDNPDKIRIIELEKSIRELHRQMAELKKKANGKGT